MADNSATAKLIGAFVMLIVGLSLVSVVSSSINAQNDPVTYTSAVDISPARNVSNNVNATTFRFNVSQYMNGRDVYTTWRSGYSECDINAINFSNASTTLDETTHYVFTADTGSTAGFFTLVAGTGWVDMGSNSTTLTWRTCADEYTTATFGRTALDVTVGLFAVALLLGAVGLFYSVYRDVFY